MIDNAPTTRKTPARVLCVDDNAEVRAALADLLNGSPLFECVGGAGSADQMVEYGPGLKPDLVLMDLNMPGTDPISVLPWFLDLLPDVKVIVLSAHMDRGLVDRALDAGAWGYVSKEDGMNEIVRCLRDAAAGTLAISESVAHEYGM